MSVTANDILQSAETMASSELEIDSRKSVSLAYYASYHLARESADLCPDNSHLAMGSHEQLSNRFELHGSKGGRSIAIVLQAMKKYRRSADYEINDSFERSLALSQVAQAKVFSERLASFENANRIKSA